MGNLTYVYWGNTVYEWIYALLIVFASVIIGKVLYWIFGSIFKRMAAKTKSDIDDIIVDMIEEPIVLSIILGGFWYASNTLVLSQFAQDLVGKALNIALAINIAWLISRLFDSMFKKYIIPLADKTETDLDDQLMPIIRKGAKFIIWSVGFIVGMNNAGYDVAALIAGLGIGGLALAMASKDMVSNIFGGFTIFADKPFTLNDRVKVSGYDGNIIEIGVRSTRLKTLEGRIVTIPNSRFSDSPVENVSSEESRKVVLNLGLTYDTSADGMRRAMDILGEIDAADERTTDGTKIAFNAFGDSALNILFIYYIKKGEDILKTMTDMDLAILERFSAEGLDFAFPTQTIYAKRE